MKAPTQDDKERSDSVSSTPSDGMVFSSNSEPFFSPSVLAESQKEPSAVDTASVSSTNVLRTDSFSSVSSESNSVGNRSFDSRTGGSIFKSETKNHMESETAFSPVSDETESTPVINAHTTAAKSSETTKGFQVSFAAPAGVATSLENSKSAQESSPSQEGMFGQQDLFANFGNQGRAAGDMGASFDSGFPVDDPFAPSGDQNSDMFVSSENFKAAFETNQFSSDPFGAALSEKTENMITEGDESENVAFPTRGSTGFEAAFDTTPFSPDPFDSAFADSNAQERTEKRVLEAESQSAQESGSFKAAFDTTPFAPAAFGSAKPKDDEPQNLEKRTLGPEINSAQESASFEATFNSAECRPNPFESVESKDGELQSTVENSEETKTQVGQESGGFEVAFDTVSSKSDEPQDTGKSVDDNSTQESGTFETAFGAAPLSADPFGSVTSKADEPQGTKKSAEDQSSAGSGKFEVAFDTAFETVPFSADPFGSVTSKADEPQGTKKSAEDQSSAGSGKFEVAFDTAFETVPFSADPFGSVTSKADEPQGTKKSAEDQSSAGSGKFEVAFDTAFETAADSFGTVTSKADQPQSTAKRMEGQATGSEQFEAAFGTAAFATDPFGSVSSKDDKPQSARESTEEVKSHSAQNSAGFEVRFDAAPFDSSMSKSDEPQITTEGAEETKSHSFEAVFDATQFPDDPFKSTDSKGKESEAFETNSPWGNAFGQFESSSFGEAFTPEPSTVADTATAPPAPAASMNVPGDAVFAEATSVSITSPALSSTSTSSDDTDRKSPASTRKTMTSSDAFESLKVSLASLSTKQEGPSVELNVEETDAVEKGSEVNEVEQDTTESVPTFHQDKEIGTKQEVDTICGQGEERPNELHLSELKVSTDRPVSPSMPPPLPPRIMASPPPLPARPRSTSNISTSSLGAMASHGYSGPTPPPLKKTDISKKMPPALPPRVDLQGKAGLDENQSKLDLFASDALKAVFNGTEASTDTSSTSWAAAWPSETKTGNTQETSGADKSADPFSEDFFTNFESPQQDTEKASAVVSQDPFGDPFSPKDPPASTDFGGQDLFASFPPANRQNSGSGDNLADPFSNSLSSFSADDPFDGISDPFAEKGALGDDLFANSPQKPNQGDSLKLSNEVSG